MYRLNRYLKDFFRALFVILAVISIALLSLSIATFIPPPNSEFVARQVSSLGHDTTDIYFTFVEIAGWGGRWIFESCQPIYYNGEYIQQWMVRGVPPMPMDRRIHPSVTPIVG